MVNTQVGEILAELGDRKYLLRPSFEALASIGTPQEIDSTLRACLSASTYTQNNMTPPVWTLSSCAHVITCCGDLDIEHTGWIEESRKGRMIWRQKSIPTDDLVLVANHLLKWGISGSPRTKAKKGKPGLFDPAEFVAIAMLPSDAGGLGQSRSEAWSLTMTEFQRACEARKAAYGKSKPEPLTREEAQAAFSAYEAKRRGN